MRIKMFHKEALLEEVVCEEVEFTADKLNVVMNGLSDYVAVRKNGDWKCLNSDFPITRFEIGK